MVVKAINHFIRNSKNFNKREKALSMIEIKNVIKSYGQNENRTEILHGISFSIPEKSFVSILGTSGSGKTTLLNCIAGIEEVDSGDIIFGETNMKKLTKEGRKKFRREHIGMVFQEFELLPVLNVRENILMPIKLNKTKVDEVYFEEIVKTLGIEEKLTSSVHKLSGGQKQRVAIARALITKPMILLADEPTGNLDRKNTLEVMELFQRCNKELDTTICMITHDQSISEMADKIIHIEDGRVENGID